MNSANTTTAPAVRPSGPITTLALVRLTHGPVGWAAHAPALVLWAQHRLRRSPVASGATVPTPPRRDLPGPFC
ncbi:hypothetical protein [Amnibacterium setariae]|uniref:Uncharacterized protein n=1 Tax=Amnibacterium setariae TaxID=2306585 RepID=A0A3A1TSS3_9MICO|nr:hypothetical protein [Amnibacterium setariae]RIX26403.1 hypothetical protein D1781_15760 [Amnibacterium setariae]